MSNTYVNKVIYGNTTLIDISDDNVTAADVASGKIFHLPTGEQSVGTATSGVVIVRDTTDAGGGTIREITTTDEIYLTDLNVTSNGTYNAPEDTAYEKVSVNVQANPTLQSKSKSYTPSETAQSETVTADSGYDGLSAVDVSVSAISPTYVGSEVARRSSSDLTVSGATVTAPAGYYDSSASKSVTTMTLPTSTSTSATSGYTSKATIGRNTSARYLNIPPGYNGTGGYYTISATPDGTVTAPSSISGTAATVSTGTNTLTLSKSVSVTPTVSTAGYVSSGTAGNSSVSLTADVTTKAAETYHPSTSDQTIAASQYLTGAQTIKAVTTTNLTAENIAEGVTVKIGDSTDDDCVTSVIGTYSGGGSENEYIRAYLTVVNGTGNGELTSTRPMWVWNAYILSSSYVYRSEAVTSAKSRTAVYLPTFGGSKGILTAITSTVTSTSNVGVELDSSSSGVTVISSKNRYIALACDADAEIILNATNDN